MRTKVVNIIDKCPRGCDEVLVEVEHKILYGLGGYDIQVTVDCLHSGVCKYREKREHPYDNLDVQVKEA